MIARLKGTLIDKAANTVIVDTQGVGYLVLVSAHTLGKLGAIGQTAELHIHTQFSFQDGKITLYGFADSQEQELFDLLLEVKGVSASKALPILSNADPVAIATWIAAEKVTELKACRGIGKKTAEAVVFELKDKCEALLVRWGTGDGVVLAAPRPMSRGARAPVLDEVGSALLSMGWKPAEVETAMGQLKVPPGATIETLLLEALQSMPR